MTLDDALDHIMHYGMDRGLDSLGSIEQMVKNYRLLTSEQRKAVTVFMDKTKELV